MVLDALLEGFEPGKHPRDPMGRWTEVDHLAHALGQLPEGGKYPLVSGQGAAAGHIERTSSGFRTTYGGSTVTHNLARAAAVHGVKVQKQARAGETTRQQSRRANLDRNAVAHRRRQRAGLPDARPKTLYPGLVASLIDSGRLEEKIGNIEKGAFHRWLGKSDDEPITDADIQKGLAAGGHPAKMAQFAKASRKFGK